MATLGNPKNTIEVLQKYNFNFQKKFGQNFLINTGILEDIIAAAEITKDDFVLEIGPGIGTMTQYLCESAREVIAVEIDKNLIPILEDTLSAYDNVEVLNEDILKDFLIANKAEVIAVSIFEFDEEKEWRMFGEAEREAERKELLISLVNDKLISIAEAANRFGVSENEFKRYL